MCYLVQFELSSASFDDGRRMPACRSPLLSGDQSSCPTAFVLCGLRALPQEVNKLCDELVARRTGAVSQAKATSFQENAAADDFWANGGGGLAVGACSVPRKSQQKGRVVGKVYQKGDAEDFWGGSSTAAASVKSRSPPHSTATDASAAASLPTQISKAEHAGSQNVKKDSTQGSDLALKPKSNRSNQASAHRKPKGTVLKTLPATESRRGSGLSKSKTQIEAPLRSSPSPAPTDPALGWSGVTCLCMATKHALITNCTTCGKIACAAEGGYGCSFCGAALPVTGREPRRADVKETGAGAAVSDTAGAESSSLQEALARKDRLLLFDRTSASRTRVLDDQGDYFASHNWLSRQEREQAEADERALREKADEHRGARRPVKMSIDIMGRRVVETQQQESVDEGMSRGGRRAGDAGVVDIGLQAGSLTIHDTSSYAGSSSAHDADASRFTKRDGESRPQLQNMGLRGRAKEVYDVMRANLERQDQRRTHNGIAGGGISGAERNCSRLSMWRVQHEPDRDDVYQQPPMNMDGAGAGGGFTAFESQYEVPRA